MPDDVDHSLICPECGRPPGEAPPRRWRGWGWWPVLVLVGLVGVVLLGSSWGPLRRGSPPYNRPLAGGLTVGDLRRVAESGAGWEVLRDALRREELAGSSPPEWAMMSVGSVPAGSGGLDRYRHVMLGWPAPCLVWRRFEEGAATGALTVGLRGWSSWRSWFGVQVVWRPPSGGVGWSLVCNGLRLASDLVIPAGVLWVLRRSRWRRRAWVVTWVALGLAVLWVRVRDDAWYGSATTGGLNRTLTQLQMEASTAEGARGVASLMAEHCPGGAEGDPVVMTSWGLADRPMVTLVGPGSFLVADGRQIEELIPGPGRASRVWMDMGGLSATRVASQSLAEQWLVTWDGVGFVLGIPVALWLAWSGVRAVLRRRAERRGAGCCRFCGYDLKGLAGGAGVVRDG